MQSELHDLGFLFNGKLPQEDFISSILEKRLKKNLPYTQLGISNMIVVNPYQPLDILNNSTLELYADVEYKDLSREKYSLSPHIYQLAARMYFCLRRTGEDQSLILSGITGSGKTTTRNHFLSELLHLSTYNKSSERLSQKISDSLIILESFGHACTVQNSSASKYSLLQQVQFNKHGRVLGSRLLTYQFDKARVTCVPSNERSFHAFYSLLSGTTIDEKNALHINYKPKHFYYLNQSRNLIAPNWNDEIHFNDLKSAFRTCGFKDKTVTQIFQLLAVILHFGNLQFVESNHFTTTAQEPCVVKNTEVLNIIAILLGVSPSRLETCLTYKLKMIGKEVCTIFLDPEAAINQRDTFVQTLYSSLFLWIIGTLNQNISCADRDIRTVAILDQCGFQNFSSNNFQALCTNLCNEYLQCFLIHEKFNTDYKMNAIMIADGLEIPSINRDMDCFACLRLFFGEVEENVYKEIEKNHKDKSNNKTVLRDGIAGLLNRDTIKRQTGATDATDANFLASLQRQFLDQPSLHKNHQTFAFGVRHFHGLVDYSVNDFLDNNLNEVPPDFISMLKHSSSNTFISNLFKSDVTQTRLHSRGNRENVDSQDYTEPLKDSPLKRRPMETSSQLEEARGKADRRKKQDQNNVTAQPMTVFDELYTTLHDIKLYIQSTRIFSVINIRPNDSQMSTEFDHDRVQSQIRGFLIPELCVRQYIDYAYEYTFNDFVMRYERILNCFGQKVYFRNTSEKEKVGHFCVAMNWDPNKAFVGHERIWLKYDAWKELEDQLRSLEKDEKDLKNSLIQRQESLLENKALPIAPHSFNNQDSENNHVRAVTEYGYEYSSSEDIENVFELNRNHLEEEQEWDKINGFGPNKDMSEMVQDIPGPQVEHVENIPITRVRIWWTRFVWLITFWIPSPFLRWFGKMDRPDIQMAWREKVTLCTIIAFVSAVILFFIVGLSEIVCPDTRTMYSTDNVKAHGVSSDNYMSVRGMVYDMTEFSKTNHGAAGQTASESAMSDLAGYDLSSSIPPPLTAACPGLVTDASIRLMANTSANPQASFVHYSGDQLQLSSVSSMSDSRWYWDTFLPFIKGYKKGTLVHSLNDLEADANSWGRAALAINGKVYDIQDYVTTTRYYRSANDAYNFLPDTVKDIFTHYSGTDASSKWDMYKASMTIEKQKQSIDCLDNYFFIGYVDLRKTARCMFTNYLLLLFAVLMCTVILVKFISALQFGSAPVPEDHNKFVICQVPCYTEGEESIRKTINSLTVMKYDDKRKLLFIIVDGMIMGSGNNRTTPRIVLDVLGCDTIVDPEPHMFKSVGEGSKQLNYGKVYSGLYECEGHVIPYVVVVKVGKASERAKPGNRGKRDSQMICMNFLNRVHFNGEMNPLELEIYYQMNNVIGVNPSFYEYILMVDSDTEVYPDSLSYLVSSMLHDGRIMGICGETALLNENQSWITMIQVYEYYISHYLAKAFESLFGSVTCLPGCFCMYRIRTPVKNEPLIIASSIVRDYSENRVDTLHKKNLLSLGEDRYLTTLMMKHFPGHKMKFTPYAMCRTVAPDDWRILLSQRRRWINSTIHNLFEVVLLPDLCGFCCFSMRFVVLIDLIGTLTLPVSFCYLVYLVYVMISNSGPFPALAIGMLGGIYALQVILFILKRQWQHIGWMLFYLFALPVYSLFIPVYSFWHFDDFSWGNTRIVAGEKQRKLIVTDEEEFDEKMIPMKKWSDYEQALWDQGSVHSKFFDWNRAAYSQIYMNIPAYHTDAMSGYMYRNMNGSPEGTNSSTTESQSSSDKSQKASNFKVTTPSISSSPTYQPCVMRTYYGSSHNFLGQPPYPFMTELPSTCDKMAPQVSRQNSSQTPFRMDTPIMFNRPVITSSNNQDSTAHLLSGYGRYTSQTSFSRTAVFPSDEQIFEEIKKIISTADLMQVTKRNVREQLSNIFGVNMNVKKEFINRKIEDILKKCRS